MALVARTRRGQKASIDSKSRGESVLPDKAKSKKYCLRNNGEKLKQKKANDCVYSHSMEGDDGDGILSGEETNVYEFPGGSSPPQNKRKRKRESRKKQAPHFTEFYLSPSNLKQETRKLFEGSVLRESNKGAEKRRDDKENISMKRSKKVRIPLTKGKTEEMVSREDKENIPAKPSTHLRIKPGMQVPAEENQQAMMMEAESCCPTPEAEENTISATTVNENKKGEKLEIAARPAQENRTRKNALYKNQGNTSLTVLESTPLKEQERNTNSGSFAKPLQGDRDLLGASPIQQEPTSSCMRANCNMQRVCVENLNAENYFGFDEIDESTEVSFSTSSFMDSSMPYTENRPTRLNIHLSRTPLLTPRYEIKKQGSHVTTSPSSNGTESLEENTRPRKDQQDMSPVELEEITSDSGVESTLQHSDNTEISREHSLFTEHPIEVKDEAIQVTTIKQSSDVKDEIVQVSSTEVRDEAIQTMAADESVELDTDSGEETTSSSQRDTSGNKSSVLFEDDDGDEFFPTPPRRSYSHMSSRYRTHSESEVESVNEDKKEEKKKKKPKRSKKPKQDKDMEEWVSNISAEFDDIDSFELFVE